MSFPPPPPDRMHLQYQPQPPQAGPGGAYGPLQQRPDQPLPGQLPPPAITMAKPGTITGIQAILWIFTALGGLGDIASAIGLVEYFSVFGLIGLAWAVYSTIQALTSGIHITRGKRWAWIWSLVSAILGLVISTAAIVFGVVYIETGWLSLLIGLVLGGLYGTLLGLLCSKSARQWILMHRIQRGEVQLPGAAPGAYGQAGPAEPQRPETRPGAATLAVVAIVLLALVSAWGVFNQIRPIPDMAAGDAAMLGGRPIGGMLPPWIGFIGNTVVFIGALIAAPLLLKGKSGGRIFGIIWAVFAVLVFATVLTGVVLDYLDGYYDFPVFPGQIDPKVPAFGWSIGRFALGLFVFVLLLTPGVRAWTPARPVSALIVVVPQAQPYGPQQAPYQQQPPPPPGPYGPQPPYGG
jgi:hypothetical protein